MKELTRRELDDLSPDTLPRSLSISTRRAHKAFGREAVDVFGCQSCDCEELLMFYSNGAIGLVCSKCQKLFVRIKVAKS